MAAVAGAGESAADSMKNSSNAVDALLGVPFHVDSIDPAPAPDGSGGTWYRYVVKQGSTNTITGIRSGTRQEVSGRIEAMVEALNQRRLGNYKYASKGRPPGRVTQKGTGEPGAG
jgi:hypothetical protein